MSENEAVEPELQEGASIMRPHSRRGYRLKDLLKRITADNVHDEVESGESIGREARW